MSTLRPSEQLRFKIHLAQPRLDRVAARFWGHPRLVEMVPDFLLLLHSMIRTSVPMMEAAAEAAKRLPPEDPTGPPLADYFSRHAREELHHDDWLLEDMETLGMDRGEALERLPSTTVASLIGAHYYWIYHVHPVALLGYLAVLEGNPPKVEQLEDIRRRTGLPAAAFRTLIQHAHLDPHHRDDLNDEIDRLALTPRLAVLLSASAFHTVEQVTRGFEEILEAHSL